jgi:D-alanyl-lipoteichoic acid acyltransferase DltB (MBOAT superfamily)
MLFNSYVFIFCFLPIVFFGFYLLGRYSSNLAALWLALASLSFYAYWNVYFVSLLIASIGFNYGAGYLIGNSVAQKNKQAKLLLIIAISINLTLLAYFKYVNFFIENINYLTAANLAIKDVFLPLGISFFTFTQIAFLVDTYQGKVKEYNFVHYTLFVTYFPHLIAGPVLHHKEMMPQFARLETYQVNYKNIAIGLTIFILGLAKKVYLADTMAGFATPIFNSLIDGGQPLFFEAWIGALAYSLQLYFDFSAYSDMAIGLSLLFNIQLPINFNSPYKATNIIEFWRRWHMTLSRFLRDYLYIPLGGNRNGKTQRYINLMITMLLGGLWHGAGWTFIIWGGLHGFYLIINHAWHNIKQRLNWHNDSQWSIIMGRMLTFLAVVIAWVFFRADSFSSAIAMLQGMLGMNGFSLPISLEIYWHKYGLSYSQILSFNGLHTLTENKGKNDVMMLVLGLFIVFKLPNFQQFVLDSEIEINKRLFQWKPNLGWAVIAGIVFFASLLVMNAPSEFLYFQF